MENWNRSNKNLKQDKIEIEKKNESRPAYSLASLFHLFMIVMNSIKSCKAFSWILRSDIILGEMGQINFQTRETLQVVRNSYANFSNNPTILGH